MKIVLIVYMTLMDIQLFWQSRLHATSVIIVMLNPCGVCVSRLLYVTAHAKMSHLSIKTYSCFITYSNRAHTEQKYDTSMPSIFTLFPEI